MPKLTISEIASLAGVSQATVSRVLNDHPRVLPETRQRVLSVIDESGYVPSAAARNLANKHTRVVCLLLPRDPATAFTGRYYGTIIPAISELCSDAGYLLVISMLGSKEMEKRFYYQAVRGGQFDGVIVLDPEMDDPILPLLLKDNTAFVMFGRHAYLRNITWVDVDNREGARLAVTHLLQQGFRRVATITGALTRAWAIDRRDGYKQALMEHGIEVDPALIVEGDRDEASGYRGMMRLLNAPQRPDAVFAPAEPMATGVFHAVREMGLAVPRDMAVVTWDDFTPGAFPGVGMTTVVQPIIETAAAAVDLLIQRIENPDLPHVHKVLPVQLVVRDSSVRPPSLAIGAGKEANRQTQPVSSSHLLHSAVLFSNRTPRGGLPVSDRTLSRRRFLHLSAITAGAVTLAACGATPTATPVPPTATKPPAAARPLRPPPDRRATAPPPRSRCAHGHQAAAAAATGSACRRRPANLKPHPDRQARRRRRRRGTTIGSLKEAPDAGRPGQGRQAAAGGRALPARRPLVLKPVHQTGKYGGIWRRGFTGPGDNLNG